MNALLEEVVLPIGRNDVQAQWMKDRPEAVALGNGRFSITLAAGSVPPRELAWMVKDKSLWSDGKVPAEPSNVGQPPMQYYRSQRDRWWDGMAVLKYRTSAPPNAPDPEPVDGLGRPLSGEVHRQWARRLARRLRR
ncbi:MAG: hypothetical protein JWL79_3088 [Frankiales bacterium]|nr:hypothetical protein [Frankiales bacterium]